MAVAIDRQRHEGSSEEGRRMAHGRVLTIYNCGTNFNRDKGTATGAGQAGELIAYLYDQTAHPDINGYGRLDRPAYAYKLIHDGPGSAPAAYGRSERDAAGTRQFVQHPARESAAKTPGLKPGANPLSALVHKAAGSLFGTGWEANVANAVKTVKALKHRPEVINMAGWSRGGVTCHMIANALYRSRSTSSRSTRCPAGSTSCTARPSSR
jgi:hypothetical protein